MTEPSFPRFWLPRNREHCSISHFRSRPKKACHLHFCDFLFCCKTSLWSGSKGVARKKHRREKNSIQRSPRASAESGGPAGDPPDRPYADSARGWGSGAVPARSKKMIGASWFLRATSLLPGRAMPGIQCGLGLLAKKLGGKLKRSGRESVLPGPTVDLEMGHPRPRVKANRDGRGGG